MRIRRINFNLKTTQTRLFIYLVASHTLKLVFLHFGQTLGFFSLLSDAFEVFICVVLVAFGVVLFAAFGVVLFAAFGVALVAISSIDVSVALAGANITIALSLQNSSLLKQSKNITLNAQSIEKAT